MPPFAPGTPCTQGCVVYPIGTKGIGRFGLSCFGMGEGGGVNPTAKGLSLS
jgi:hypothetical protein